MARKTCTKCGKSHSETGRLCKTCKAKPMPKTAEKPAPKAAPIDRGAGEEALSALMAAKMQKAGLKAPMFRKGPKNIY